MKQYHMCITFEGAINNYETMIITENDVNRPATIIEICEAITEARKKGYTVLPPCDNVDDRGYCKGHIINEERKSLGT